MMNIFLLLIAYFVIPFTVGWFVHQLSKKVLPGYRDEIYHFEVLKD